MWFVLLGIALTLVVVGGLYFRRRLLAALELFGVTYRVRRIVGWLLVWLLYGLPILTFVVVFLSIALGRDTFVRPPAGGIGEWLLVYPFWFTVLVMLQSVPWLVAIDLGALALRKRLPLERLATVRAVGCVAVIAIFSVYMPVRIVVERGDLDVNHYELGDGSSPPLRIAFLADLQQDHHTDEERARQVVDVINGREPDIVLSGGDWINSGPDYIEAAAKSAGMLRSRLGTTSVPGDHEHFAYRDQQRSLREVSQALESNGVSMIENEVRFIEHAGKRIAIVYLYHNYIHRTPAGEITRLIDSAQDADYRIAVSHQFDNKLGKLLEDRVDLALIAHTHGGQINPVVGVMHANIARVETPFVAGRYQLGNTTVIVTSGIGFSIAPFRYAAPATIEIIDLRL